MRWLFLPTKTALVSTEGLLAPIRTAFFSGKPGFLGDKNGLFFEKNGVCFWQNGESYSPALKGTPSILEGEPNLLPQRGPRLEGELIILYNMVRVRA